MKKMPIYDVSTELSPEEAFYDQLCKDAEEAQLDYCKERGFTHHETQQYLSQSIDAEELVLHYLIGEAHEFKEGKMDSARRKKLRSKLSQINGAKGGDASANKRQALAHCRYECICELVQVILEKRPNLKAKKIAEEEIHPFLEEEGKEYLEKAENYTPKEKIEYMKAFEVKFDQVYDDVRRAMKELRDDKGEKGDAT